MEESTEWSGTSTFHIGKYTADGLFLCNLFTKQDLDVPYLIIVLSVASASHREFSISMPQYGIDSNLKAGVERKDAKY